MPLPEVSDVMQTWVDPAGGSTWKIHPHSQWYKDHLAAVAAGNAPPPPAPLSTRKPAVAVTTTEHASAPAPTPAAMPVQRPSAAALPAPARLSLEERCIAAWKRDPELRAEFVNDLGAYVAYTRADEAGHAKIFGRPSSAVTTAPAMPDVTTFTGTLDERCRAQWNKDPALRAEFVDNFGTYLAFTKADEAGLVKVFEKRG